MFKAIGLVGGGRWDLKKPTTADMAFSLGMKRQTPEHLSHKTPGIIPQVKRVNHTWVIYVCVERKETGAVHLHAQRLPFPDGRELASRPSRKPL